MQQVQMDFNSNQNEQKAESEEPRVFSVSELNKQIRQKLESSYSLVWIQGEISNFKAHSSGHHYFSLKDKKAQINAVMFRGFNSRLKFRPEDGAEVLIRGKVTVYEPRGNYQIFCETMEPVGAGALQVAFEQLKAKLKSEGLFDSDRKRALPELPKHIALITSPTGAAVQDMLNVLNRRFRGVRVTLIPALVQGAQAPADIVRAFGLAEQLKDVDVIICGRGGGSLEDLWAFNDEAVARAIVASKVPVISAVGHEVDFTIADFVSDLRAPTPSAAAELVVKNVTELNERIANFRQRLRYSMIQKLKTLNHTLLSAQKSLVDPRRRLQDLSLRCDELTQRMEKAIGYWLQHRKQSLLLYQKRMGTPQDRLDRLRSQVKMCSVKLAHLQGQSLIEQRSKLSRMTAVLDSLSPLKVVDRGYSIVTHAQGVVKSVTDVNIGETVKIKLADGHIEAEVKNLEKK